MKLMIVPIGDVDPDLMYRVGEGVVSVIPRTAFTISSEKVALLPEHYDAYRRQYRSTALLDELRSKAKFLSSDRVLGITSVDIYYPGMNFIFGEAELWGRCCLISTFRLNPERYGLPDREDLFIRRCVKEAIHELGHTLGLRHCSDPSCVMSFSINLLAVDRKEAGFCERCFKHIDAATED